MPNQPESEVTDSHVNIITAKIIKKDHLMFGKSGWISQISGDEEGGKAKLVYWVIFEPEDTPISFSRDEIELLGLI
jgi:hypothetical protein